jgi:LDH2 family malate/lactate/ureidoglycolate dehydrogenase
MITEIRNEPPIDPDLPIMVPGDPEKISEKKRLKNGIPVESGIIKEINEMIYQQGLEKELKL